VRKLFQYRSTQDTNGYLRLNIESIETADTEVEQQFGLFRSPRQASKQMEKLADQFFLCHQLLGLESHRNSSQGCFRSQLKKCFGACHGAESAQSYNQRMSAALKNYQIKLWPYVGPILLEERDPQVPDQVAFHLVDRWRYLAKLPILEDVYDFGYQLADQTHQSLIPEAQVAEGEVIVSEDEVEPRFDLDIYFILVRFLVNQKKMNMHHLKIWPLIKPELLP